VARAVFPADPHSAHEARAFLTDRLRRGGASESAIDAGAICVSELVTNAVVHAGTRVEVCVEQQDDIFHVEVRDHRRASVLVAPEPPGPQDTHGRGLFLVAALAVAWGITEQPGGKVIWFDVHDGSDPRAATG
jgi:anti-sigma regulatory factor (Ser/Thr protein kinase)